jgi:hypothetical protein
MKSYTEKKHAAIYAAYKKYLATGMKKSHAVIKVAAETPISSVRVYYIIKKVEKANN